MPTTKQVILGTISALAVGGVCYAVYFDYKRRNDPKFRKKLKKQRKMAKKIRQANSEKATSTDKASLKIENQVEAIRKVIMDEPIPTEMEAKESFFMQQLQKGEMLIYQGKPFYDVAALCYYRAFKVYPNPTELIILFQRSTPEPVYKKIIEYITEDVKKKQEEYFDIYPAKEMNVKLDKKTLDLILDKDVTAGEVIYKETPIIAVLDPRIENTNYCSHCLKRFEGEGVKGKDKNVIFCSEECSKEAWEKYNKYLYQPTLDDITEALKSSDKIEIINTEPIDTEAPATILGEVSTEKEEEETKEEEKKEDEAEEKKEGETEEKKNEEPSDIDAFWNLLKDNKKKCPMMIARFVAKMIDRELNSKTNTEKYSEWDHLERFTSLDDIKNDEIEEKELKLIQSIIGKHSNEILPNEYYNMLKARFLYNIYSIPANKEDIELDLPESTELARYVKGKPIIGAGLYHISSFIHNSCTPNVEVQFLDNNNVLSLVALEDIKSGEVLHVSYIDTTGKTPEECKSIVEEKFKIKKDIEIEGEGKKEEEKVEEEKVEEQKEEEEKVEEERVEEQKEEVKVEEEKIEEQKEEEVKVEEQKVEEQKEEEVKVEEQKVEEQKEEVKVEEEKIEEKIDVEEKVEEINKTETETEA